MLLKKVLPSYKMSQHYRMYIVFLLLYCFNIFYNSSCVLEAVTVKQVCIVMFICQHQLKYSELSAPDV